MRIRSSAAALGIFLTIASAALSGSERATLTGNVADAAGKPIEHATVMVYAAGVKKGYSTYCPTCYTDCGKRAITGAGGTFTIQGLSPGLWFKLLVVRDGYMPEFVNKVDPAKGPATTAILKPRQYVDDPARVVRGRVANVHGEPQRDAVVQPQGVSFGARSAVYGIVPGLDPIAVTNEKGEFQIAYATPAVAMLLLVEARGMAPKLFKETPTGPERHTMTVMDGASVRGRVVDGGKPVGGVEIGLVARNRGMSPDPARMGDPYSEIRIGTQPDGSFIITNVPAPVEWYVDGKMESIAARGATAIIECATTRDNEAIDLGDIQIKRGHRLRGRVVLSDGKPIPDGMRVTIGSDRAFDSQTAMLAPDGRFEFEGLRSDSYSVFASVKGYRLASGNPSGLPVSVDADIHDLKIILDQAPPH